MTEDTLTRFVERLNEDPTFRRTAQRDPAGALAQFDPRRAEQVARASEGEDALRRLAETRVQEQARIWTWIKKQASRLFCGPGRTRSWECPKKVG